MQKKDPKNKEIADMMVKSQIYEKIKNRYRKTRRGSKLMSKLKLSKPLTRTDLKNIKDTLDYNVNELKKQPRYQQKSTETIEKEVVDIITSDSTDKEKLSDMKEYIGDNPEMSNALLKMKDGMITLQEAKVRFRRNEHLVEQNMMRENEIKLNDINYNEVTTEDRSTFEKERNTAIRNVIDSI